MEYKTTEAKRKANSKYRKANKEEEKVKTYRRTAKMYLTKYAELADILLFQKIIVERVKELAANEPDKSDEIRKVYLEKLSDQEEKLKEE
ncbi:hypothetical protein JZO77_03410 [Enterococcus hulanensis]|uniref:hypothetical protein n=1 Tax=Enterococcus hulanensis TaxID=2559929 RepID=UPI001A8FD796|nr:hypothetical protein [Enterococcus hulanensis]MBO0455786.1 hypothetical protein [Enterococcus hulanensis]